MSKKRILATLLCLTLVSMLVGTVVAYTPPPSPTSPYFTLYAVVSSDLPYATWMGGYHDIVYELQGMLAQIGINLEVRMYDQWTIWSSLWEENYNVSTVDALPPNGWDITMSDWWVGTTSTIWQESFLDTAYMPPNGYNIMSYSNDDVDDLLHKGIHTLDAETRQFNLWAFQEEFMHDPPMINLFYPVYYDPTGSYVDGYSGTVWFSTVDYLGLDASNMTDARKGMGEKTFFLGTAQDMPNAMSLYMSGYTQSAYQYMVQDSLYMGEYDYNATIKEFIPGTLKVEPQLAYDFPTFRDGPNGPKTVAIIPLRDDVWWVWPNNTKSEKFDAYDAAFSINTVTNPATYSPAYGEWAPVVESAEVLDNATLQGYGLFNVTNRMYYPYAVQINLKTISADFIALISMNWGAGMLPEHLLGGLSGATALKSSIYYSDPSAWAFTGPYVFDHWTKDSEVGLKANKYYYGRNMTGIVDEILIKIIPNDATRNAHMETNQIDAAEFTWAPLDVFENWKANPNIHVASYEASQSNNIMFNLNNPYLSNRYVRLAIAHAIDYEHIYDVVKGWGIDPDLEHFHPGKTTIPPHSTYTEPDDPLDPDLNGVTVGLFNEDLPPYTYDLAKAQEYMNMWLYSLDKDTLPGNDNPAVYNLGPVGDGDFSGFVELDDYYVWSGTMAEGWTTPPEWQFNPGNDIDPDYDNNATVLLWDYYMWRDASGTYYPDVWGR